MEEQFILRVPPSVAERIERLLNENASSSLDGSLDISFSEDGRSGTFMIGNERFPASLLDLPCMVESYKTYDDNVLIKTADVGQMIMVRDEGDAAVEGVEYKHGLTPPMRDARRRRFRREPDLNPEVVQRVEKDLLNIMSGLHVETVVPEAGGQRKKNAPVAAPKPDEVHVKSAGAHHAVVNKQLLKLQAPSPSRLAGINCDAGTEEKTKYFEPKQQELGFPRCDSTSSAWGLWLYWGFCFGAMSKQPLIYSFVAKGTVVLAEHTTFSGNFSTIAVQCLQKLPRNSNKFTYSCDGYTFNFLLDNEFVFLVVADEAVGRSVPFVFLERVKEDFMQRYGASIDGGGPHPLADEDEDDDLFEDRFSIAYNLDREFGPSLKEHMQYCTNHPEEMSKLSKLRAQITEVKGIMMDNIDKVLDRGEKIELLVDKTESLQFQADSFQREGRQLRRKMWLQSIRIKLIVAGTLIGFILVLWVGACGGFKC
ncbi:vesicle-associated membrane protein [Musa troglodytarum]|uniref:Vesicle-associated membrane protein n=2 Tax=Musa troglodytarum TaxID=320322 RepID=A0A9E7KZE8_9LILI|nr:vesicle-associated membrane protein [Musa troglodytarum]